MSPDATAPTARDREMYIDGVWGPSERGARMDAWSPATGAHIGTVPDGTREDVRRAIAAADDASDAWSRASAFERAQLMERISEVVAERRDSLAYMLTLDQGKPLASEAYAEVDELVTYFQMAAADVRRFDGELPPSAHADKRVMVQRVPRGVVGVISPWNWPYTVPAEALAPALASGNTVVWVPAPTTALCAVELTRVFEEAGLPAGVINLVTGPGPVVGDELAGHPGVSTIAFIGSIETGTRVASRAAGKAMLLELGGNGPTVVLDDADLDLAADAALESSFLCAGQSCTAGELFLVQQPVYEEFIGRVASRVKDRVRLGDPFDGATTMGPLNNEAVAAKTERHVQGAIAGGASVLTGGGRAWGFPTDLYFEPTLLGAVTEMMEISQHETFGPVIPVQAIADEREAVRLANGSPYGLFSAIFTADLRRGLRYAEATRTGWVNINSSSNDWEIHLPTGGRAGSRSGLGRAGGRFPLETFTERKTIRFVLD